MEMIKYTEENKKLYEDFLNFANNEAINKDADQEEISKKLKEYENKFNTDNIPTEKKKLPYYEVMRGAQNKILLKDLKNIDNDVIEITSKIISDFIVSFYRTMFYTSKLDRYNCNYNKIAGYPAILLFYIVIVLGDNI